MLVEENKLTLLCRKVLIQGLESKMVRERMFYLSGMSGIGKTEILSYCYWKCQDEIKVFLDPVEVNFSDLIKEIARSQGIQLTRDRKRKTSVELQTEILKADEITLFIDNFHKLTQKQCEYFLKLNRFCKLYLSMDEKYLKREEQKELIQGKERIRVHPIKEKDRENFAIYVLDKLKNREIDPKELAKNSRGIPRRFWNLAKGKELYRSVDDRIDEEEINISGIVITVLSVTSALRYFARGTGEKDLYILSAIAIGICGLFKCFLRELNKK